MKQLLILILLVTIAPKISFSQEVKKKGDIFYMFNPEADAQKDLDKAVTAANKTHRHILIIVGGDWNYWSRKFYEHIQKVKYDNPSKFEMVIINFSPANRNEAMFKALDIPHDRGYPILIVMDEKQNKLIVTDIDALKENLSLFNEQRLRAFEEKWLLYQGKS